MGLHHHQSLLSPFYHHFAPKLLMLFFNLLRQMPPISKTDCCADRSILALLSAYQEYLVTFQLMTSQVVQRARPLRTCTYVLGSQRVNGIFCENLGVKRLIFPRFLLFQCCIGVARSFTAIPNYSLKIPFTFVKILSLSLNSISFLAP